MHNAEQQRAGGRAPAGLVGIDVGASTIEVVLCAPTGDVRHTAFAPSRGRPSATLAELLAGLPLDPSGDAAVRLAVTGSGHAFASALGATFVNEIIATARGVQDACPGARTILDLGAQFSKWILLGAGPSCPGTVVDFASNGLCAAGAGAFLEQQASRLGLDAAALGRLAAGAARGASIAGRCSVFAKSDMIHLQQRGTPPDEIAYGLCLALARTFLATVVQGRTLAPPVVLVGGGARNPGLARAFAELLGLGAEAILVPDDAEFLGAIGAARMAGGAELTTLPAAIGRLGRLAPSVAPCDGDRGPALPPLGPAPRAAPRARERPVVAGVARAYLGVDVGSVSTNLVLLAPDLTLVEGVYLPTRGRPVEALREGLEQIERRFGGRLEILGAGATGSGRHLAARLLGADVVRNEITAQLTAALAVDPKVDTIFEIGGQDSKYIAVRDGRLADFEMNKICAGGTGSFLEEQAARLGVRIEEEFAALAFGGGAPCDLGARCTVFMDAELARALERDVPVADICAGLAYAVARNYLEKVVAGRPVGRAILFQGGTASNAAVVEAFRRLLGRPVRVHPHNRLSGAIGAARLAARARPARSAFRGLGACSGAVRRTFECHRCENRCQVNRIEVDGRAAHFGDICERYAERDGPAAPVARPFPELFAAREALFERELAGTGSGGATGQPIGLVRATLNLEFLPFWVTFLRALGYAPVVSGRTTAGLMHAHAQGVPAEVCLPIKAAAAHARALAADGAVGRLFVPALVECPPPEGDQQSHTCFYSQQLPDMLRAELKDRMITTQFSLGRGLLSLVEPTLKLAEALERPVDAVLRALRKANAAHARFVAERRALGRSALAARFDRAVVVLGRPYNTHDGFLNLSLARLMERLGLPAIPWDLLPLERVQLEDRWRSVPWHYSREQLRAIALMRDDPRLFPILISSYGCGPDAFVVKHVEELVAGRPRLLLEFDEHRGEAGLVTRLEAFGDEIDEHLGQGGRAPAATTLTPGPRAQPAGRRFFLPRFLPHAGVYAAVLRAQGHEATVLDPPDEATVRLGDELASGRECHPYVILGGELARLLRHTAPRRGDVFLFPNCTSPCLLRQYGDGYRILLRRHRAEVLEIWDADLGQLGQFVGVTGLVQLYEGLLATDILLVLGSRLRPYQARPETFARRFDETLARIAGAVAARQPLGEALAVSAEALWALPRSGAPGSRPVVGVTGDLYTRTNPIGNADVFLRLEGMGIEVWPSPYFATMADLAAALQLPHSTETVSLRSAALDYLTTAMTARVQRGLVQALPADVARLALEPPAAELIELARPYVGPRTNHLIQLIVAKTADFLRRGATGVVSVAGINCMVGTAAAALIPALRADFDQAPVISLSYGGAEGPAQRIRLETFVEQVYERWRRHAA